MNRLLKFIFVSLLTLASSGLEARSFVEKSSSEEAEIDGKRIVVFTYQPSSCEIKGLLFVFAGYNRDADKYRDKAKPIADRECLTVLAPLLDRQRFPNWRYQYAGIIRNGEIQPRNMWTGPFIGRIIEWGRTRSGNPNTPYILFGHSAGAQLLGRLAAFSPPSGAMRIVLANPSAYVLPTYDEEVPYGLRGVDNASGGRICEYLALPITIFSGGEDTKQRLLNTDDGAMRQGQNRHERAETVYRFARKIAEKDGCGLAWRYLEVRGVGHSAARMLDNPLTPAAMGLKSMSVE